MPSMDPGTITSSLSDDPDMRELVEDFVAALPERVQNLQASLAAGDLNTLTHLAHQLKGSSGGYGFDVIGQAAAVLETSAKTADSGSAVAEQVAELVNLCCRAKAGPVK